MPFDFPGAILFDIDGTLMDDDRAVLRGLSALQARHRQTLGISMDELTRRWRDLLALHFGRYLAGEISLQEQRRARILDLFAPSNLSQEDADRIFADYETHYRASWSAYPEAEPALKALSRYRLAVLSNGDFAQQTQKLRAGALAGYFSGIFTSSEIGCAKPAVGAFLEVCRRLGVSPRSCMYVGDSLETDARASASAGLASVWLDRARSGDDPGFNIRVIHDLSELPPLMGQID